MLELQTQSTTPSQYDDSDSQNLSSTTKYFPIAAAFSIMFIGIGYTNAFGVFLDHYQTTLFPTSPPSKIILIGSVASSLYMLLGVLTGRFADAFGYQVAVAIGSVLMIASMFAASVSMEFYQFFLTQGVMFGLGVAFAYLPAVAVSRQYFRTRHGLVNGIVVSGGALGGCILPYVVRVLLSSRGLSSTFRMLGYLAAAVLGPSILLLRPLEKPRRGGHVVELSLLRDRRFVALLVAGTTAMTGFLPRYFLITPSAIESGLSATYASWVLGIMNGLSIVGRVGIGWLADRSGKVNALVVSFVLCGLGHIVFWLPAVLSKNVETSAVLFTLFSVYIGLFGSGFVSLLPVVVADLFGSTNLASKVGLLNSIMGLGVLAGPSAINAIVSNGQWSVGVVTAGLFMIMGGAGMAGAFYGIKKIERRSERGD
jgi:MFS family permease